MKMLRTFTFSTLCLLALSAAAQWQWIGPDGGRVFSDQPPPNSVAPDKIIRQPGQRAPAPTTGAATPTATPGAAAGSAPNPGVTPPTPPASGLRVTGKDRELEEKKRQADAAEAEKKKIADEAQTKLSAENCERAKLTKMGLDSGGRMSRTNAQGERVVLDDNARAAEAQQAQELINSACQ